MALLEFTPFSDMKSTSLVVPHADPDLTEALRDVANGCQLVLEDALGNLDIALERRDLFHQRFRPQDHLPSDILLHFSVDATEKVTTDLQKLILQERNRIGVLVLFFAERIDTDWLHDRVLRPQHIELDEEEDLTVRMYDFDALRQRPQSVERMMQSIAERAIQKRAS